MVALLNGLSEKAFNMVAISDIVNVYGSIFDGHTTIKNLLDADVWQTMLPNTIIAKYPIQQRLNKANLGEDKFEELMSIIKE